MKYIIAYNNWAWAKYFPGTDFSQKVIYDVVSNMCTAENNNLERTENGYTWITLNLILSEAYELPINNRSSISRRIKKLEEKGLLLTYRKGDKKYYKVSNWALKNLSIAKGQWQNNTQVVKGQRLNNGQIAKGQRVGLGLKTTATFAPGDNNNTTITPTNQEQAASSAPPPKGSVLQQPAVPLYSKGVETDKKKKESCRICKNQSKHWRLKNNSRSKWLCSVCHPPMARKEQIEWQLEEEKTSSPLGGGNKVFPDDKIEETLLPEIQAVKKAITTAQPEDPFEDWAESLDNVDYTITIPADSMECRVQADRHSDSEPEPIASSLDKVLARLKPEDMTASNPEQLDVTKSNTKKAIQKYNIEEARRFGVYDSEPIVQDGITFEHVQKIGKDDADCIDTVKLIGDTADILKVIRGQNEQDEPITLTEAEIKKIDNKMTNLCRRITLPTIEQFWSNKYWLVQRLKELGDGTSQITLQEV